MKWITNHGYPERQAQASATDKLKGLGEYLPSIGALSRTMFAMTRRVRNDLLVGHLMLLERRARDVRQNGKAHRRR